MKYLFTAQYYFYLVNFMNSFVSLLLMLVTIQHYLFFRKSKKSVLSNRIRAVFFADFLSAASVFSFNVIIFLTGSLDAYYDEEWVRMSLKGFQSLSTIYTLYASWRLHQHIKEMS